MSKSNKAVPDIKFVTNKGKEVVLRWEKPEYRAYINGEKTSLGATIPKGLIEYIKERY